jgi:VanZ family protein
LEAVQTYLPGRTPETTDSVVALLMALALWRLSGRAGPCRPDP